MTESTEVALYTLVTGASSGIGQAIAERLSAGRRLILHGRNLERLAETRARCAGPERHLVWAYDLERVEGIAESLGGLVADKGIAVEAFVHSAGVAKVLPIRSIGHRQVIEVMNVNFGSAVEIISLLIKKKVNRQRLRNVLLVSSIAAQYGAPGFSMYSASKGALDSMMRALAVELAPQVRVNSIAAGGVQTPMADQLLADTAVAEKFVRDYPLGMGRPEDIVDTAEFLLSERSRWITGQAIVVDGGRSVNISV